MKQSEVPASTPGSDSGSTTWKNVARGGAPSDIAASSRLRETPSSTDCSVMIMNGSSTETSAMITPGAV